MGQSLEQIDSVFRDNKTPWSIVGASKVLASGDLGRIVEKEKVERVENVDVGVVGEKDGDGEGVKEIV